MKKSIDFFIFLSNFLISSLLTKTFVFYLIYVNLLFHIDFLWIMWITLCITQIYRFFNLSKMWITFTPFFALSTFSPFIRQPLCNLLNIPFSSTIFAKRKRVTVPYKLRRNYNSFCFILYSTIIFHYAELFSEFLLLLNTDIVHVLLHVSDKPSHIPGNTCRAVLLLSHVMP